MIKYVYKERWVRGKEEEEDDEESWKTCQVSKQELQGVEERADFWSELLPISLTAECVDLRAGGKVPMYVLGFW